MAVEIKKDPWVIVTNAIIALAILALVGMKVIDWKMALGGLALLLAPSVAKRARGDERTRSSDPPKDDDRDPPAGGATPLLITPIMLWIVVVGCAASPPRDKAIEAEDKYTKAHEKCAATEPSREAVADCRAKVRAEWLRAPRDGGAQ